VGRATSSTGNWLIQFELYIIKLRIIKSFSSLL
jgi:hypothetical protein